MGENDIANTTLFQILMGELEPDEGSYKWGEVQLNPIFRKITPSILTTAMKALLSGWNSMHRIPQKLI